MKHLLVAACLFCLVSLFCYQSYALSTLPSVANMGRGFDMRSGFPTINSVKYPIVTLNWEQNASVVDQTTGQIYLIPDNFDFKNDPFTQQSSTTQIFLASSVVSSSLFNSQSSGFTGFTEFGFQFIPGMYSTSSQMTTFCDSNQNGLYSASTSLQVNSWMIQANYFFFKNYNASIFDPNFLEALGSLPYPYNAQTCPSFLKFISLFGTHILMGAFWGGEVTMTSTFSESTYSQESSNQISDALALQFSLLTSSTALNSTEQNQLNQLNARYQSTIQLEGGNPGSYSPSEWPQWAKTVSSNPVPISLGLVPIYSLFWYPRDYNTDFLGDATVRYLANPPPQLLNKWSLSQSMLTPRQQFTSISVNNILYIFGGMSTIGYRVTNLVEAYDPSSGTWTNRAPMPVALANSVALTDGTTIYLFGGFDGFESDDAFWFLKYHPDSDAWDPEEEIPCFPPCFQAAGAYVDGFIIVCGNQTYSWDPLFGCGSYPPRPTYRTQVAVAGLTNVPSSYTSSGGWRQSPNTCLFLVGGVDSSGRAVDTVEYWNTSSPLGWYSTPPLHYARSNASAVGYDNKLYVMGGIDGQGNILSSVEVYDPTTKVWTLLPSMPTPTAQFSASALGEFGGIFSMGGIQSPKGSALGSVSVYHPRVSDC